MPHICAAFFFIYFFMVESQLCDYIIMCMTQELALEINKRFKKALARDPNTLTCIVTGRTRPTNSQYLETKEKKFGSKEMFIQHYICREALQLLKQGKTVQEIRLELNPDTLQSLPNSSVLKTALELNGK